MKRTILYFCVATAFLLALTGCGGRKNNMTNTVTPDRYGYDDSDYTADEDGMTNERGQDGTNDTTTNQNNTAGSSSAKGDAYNNGTTDKNTDSNGTTRPNTFGQGVQDAVDEAGNVVDDIANGAANAVDDATDAVENAAGAVTKGRTNVNRPNSAA